MQFVNCILGTDIKVLVEIEPYPAELVLYLVHTFTSPKIRGLLGGLLRGLLGGLLRGPLRGLRNGLLKCLLCGILGGILGGPERSPERLEDIKFQLC